MLKNWLDFPKCRTLCISIYKAISRQLGLAREVTLPSLSAAGLLWLISGIFLSTDSSTILLHIFNTSFIYVLLAYFLARACGMTFNRVFDAWIDSKNPRTAQRAIPSGRANQLEILMQGIFFLFSFLYITFYYLPTALSVMAIISAIAVIVYSLTKRFTYFCHYFLGVVHFCVPLVGALYVTNSFQEIRLSVWLAASAAFCSVSAADILYSLQDEVFDRRLSLYSIPVKYGKKISIKIARVTSIFSIVFASVSLVYFYPTGASFLYWICTICLFWYIWRSIRRNGYNLASSLMPLMVSSLPFLFLVAVIIQWIQFSAM